MLCQKSVKRKKKGTRSNYSELAHGFATCVGLIGVALDRSLDDLKSNFSRYPYFCGVFNVLPPIRRSKIRWVADLSA